MQHTARRTESAAIGDFGKFLLRSFVGVYSSLCACGLRYTSAAGQHGSSHVPSRSLALTGLFRIIFYLEGGCI